MDISVIIPVYNSEKTIIRSVESVVNSIEKYTKSYEIICIDDGSKDDSFEILKKLSIENPSIIPIHQENAGAAAARNAGLEIAKGKYIAFNDSDDEWEENHFEVLKSILDENQEIMCVSGNHDIDKQKLPSLSKISKDLYKITLKNELMKNYFSPQATMFNSKLISDGIRFKPGMRYAEEGYFFYTIVAKYPCAYINTKITRSILQKEKYGDGGLSGNLSEMEKGELQNLKYAYKKLNISLFSYYFYILLSLLKYIRRLVIVKLRILKNERK